MTALVVPNIKLPSLTSIGPECRGKVSALRGPAIIASLPFASLGDQCTVRRENGSTLLADVIAFQENTFVLSPLDEVSGVGIGAEVRRVRAEPQILLPLPASGLVLDANGKVLHHEAKQGDKCVRIPLQAKAPDPLRRQQISTQLATGIKVIDALCPIGHGQRLVISAPAGLGKSTLLGMITRSANVDVIVIALVGERGREVGEFLNEVLGAEGLRRAIVVVATSDESPSRRLRAPYTATAIAEYFRAQGKRVLLMVDSLTRTARAIREIGIAAGELPIRQGYTASVYSELPRLLERAGTDAHGSITALYTMLASADREPDALTDEVKSLVDGHIVLTQEMADWGIRPAIDPLKSLSRLAHRFTSREQIEIGKLLRRLIKRLMEDRDIVLLGGTPDRELQTALANEAALRNLLSQAIDTNISPQQIWADLAHFVAKLPKNA